MTLANPLIRSVLAFVIRRLSHNWYVRLFCKPSRACCEADRRSLADPDREYPKAPCDCLPPPEPAT